MDIEKLEYLIRQPEGLKLDFKSSFYEIDTQDSQAKERQWGELIKDILALANGNVNIAGETGYIIFGVGDKINADGIREISDVGNIKVTRQQILEKVNSICAPPLADLYSDLLLIQGQRIFVITIPPSPYLHETTKRIQTSRGQSYPEHTVFIRRGEGTHTASMPEIQAIASEKQKLLGKKTPARDVRTFLDTKNDVRNFFDTITIIIIIGFGGLFSILGFLFEDTINESALAALGFLFVGLIFGILYSFVVKLVHWMIRKRQNVKNFAYFIFWICVIVSIVLGGFTAKNNQEIAASVLTGLTVGTMAGLILSMIVCSIDWFIGKFRFRN